MRKAFNFYRSFYDTFNQIRRDEDKLTFITALLEKQFHNTDPEGLKDIPLFAYESQRQVIESQVQGYIDKTGEQPTPSKGGAKGAKKPPKQQEKEKGKEKENKDAFHDQAINIVIDYLNEQAGKNYPRKTESTRSLIRGRIKDGHDWRDFKAVIDNRVKLWGTDRKMREYLRPSTLFRPTNFEEYLVEARDSMPKKTTSAKKDINTEQLFGEKAEGE